MRYTFPLFAIILLAASPVVADPLHDAVRAGDVVSVQKMLDSGARVSEPDEAGEPPLIIAAMAGHSDVVALLLDHGADVEIRNKGGLTALHAAAYAGRLDVVKLLVSKGAAINDTANFYKMSPLHAAAEEGHVDVITFLIAHKAEIEAKERNGYTPLTQAGWREHWDAAAPLKHAGASCQPADLVGEWLFNECTKLP